MDDKFNDHINKLVEECLNAPSYSTLTGQLREEAAERLNNHFNLLVINLLIDSLNEEQLSQVENLPENSPELENKFEEFAAQIPGFVYMIEEKLNSEVKSIIQGQITV